MEKTNTEEMSLVQNGSVDRRGRIADKRTTGGWKGAPFIIVNEVAERLAYFAIAANIVSYLVLQMGQRIPDAASTVNKWSGAAFCLTIIGAFLADAYLGRFKTILYFSCIYSVGLVLLTLSASIESLHPPPCTALPCPSASDSQKAFLYFGLALIAVGTGGIKPCVSSFGADQFDETDEKELPKKSSFFNWFFFAINMGALFALTVLTYLIQQKGYSWGFGVPAAFTIFAVAVLVVGVPYFRFQKPTGSPFTRFFQVLVSAVRNHFNGVEVRSDFELYEVNTMESDIVGARKLSHSTKYSFLDMAAVIKNPGAITKNRWKLCTVTQVEELKSFISILPIWASTIAVTISFAQLGTFFISQALTMDRKLSSNFQIPAPSIPVFSAINALIVIPIYEKLLVPAFRKYTGNPRGITSLQRTAVGLVVTIIALVLAALVEKKRRLSPDSLQMSVFWLVPQYFLMGTSEVFAYVGLVEFFYNEVTDGTRSISSALFLAEIGIGNWLSAVIVKIVESVTGGEEKGWLRNDLNQSRLDYFYWLLATINGVSFLVYLWVAKRYKGRSNEQWSDANETSIEMSSALVQKREDIEA